MSKIVKLNDNQRQSMIEKETVIVKVYETSENIRLTTVDGLRSILNISRNKAKILMSAEGFPTLRINNQDFAMIDELDNWLYQNRNNFIYERIA